jgi:hypothetical protein
MPQLERWLARSELGRDPARNAEAWLAARFGLADAPVAAVTLAVDEAPQPGAWLRADPVFARVERDSLVLHDASHLGIEPEEARSLVGALRGLFAADGLEFRVPRPDRWYVRVPKAELPETTPLSEALGADVFGRLPRGQGRINWSSALTEIQMLFATHPVNLAREAARRPPVNSVWFWGGGSLPQGVASPYRAVFAADPFAAGLAHLSSTPVEPPPPRLEDLAADPPALAVLDVRREGLDARWFGSLAKALSRRAPVRIVLPTRHGTVVATLTRAARWRIFRRARTLSAYA